MIDLSPPAYPEVSQRTPADFAWPDRAACGVVIAWHVDGEAGPVGWDRDAARHVAAVSEAAYGVTTALPRILALHRERRIPATFFLPAHVAERHPDAVEAILRDGHEIAHHGYLHENVFGLGAGDTRAVFEHAAAILERLTGRAPRGWSAPGWGVDAAALEVMAALGLVYDASLMERDLPYFVGTAAGELVELPISLVLDDWALFGASLHGGGAASIATAAEACRIWREEFDGMRRYGGLFQTTFHPNLLGRPGRLLELERLLDHMQGFDDVWWGSCEAAAAHVLAVDGGGGDAA